MKTLISIFFFLLFCLVNGQSPNRMSYQAVIRNASNALVASQPIGMKVSVLRGSAVGPVVYAETYSPAPITNANGLVTLAIGSGTPQVGTFSTIDWYDGPYYIKTEADPTGGTTYTITGSSQLLSVPYSEFAKGLQATSHGGSGLRGGASGLWLGLYEGGVYRGYMGSFSGKNEDVDFGTGATNNLGSVHLNIAGTPKMTVDSIGNVGVGTRFPDYRFQVNGISGTFEYAGLRIHNTTANTGWSLYPSISGNMIIGKATNLGSFDGVTGVYTSLSDARVKTNFEKMDPVLESVNKLNLWRYEYRNNNPKHRKDIGVTAQDLQKYFPELVTSHTANDGNPSEQDQLFVNYSGLAVVALKALQEQQLIIENLEKRIKALENKK